MRNVKLILAALMLATLASGCATIVEGTDQTVTVTSDPSGASCELKRDGQVIGIVNPTPGSVQIDKSKKDISVQCVKEGYADAGGALGSDFQGMTFGNILFGGLIGVAVDAGSGAMHEYEPLIHVELSPQTGAPPLAPSGSAGAREEDTMAANEYVPLPPGTPAPYEGVRMSSFSDEDMQWFCSQSWRRRVSPTGRTEYNPCHVSEVFSR